MGMNEEDVTSDIERAPRTRSMDPGRLAALQAIGNSEDGRIVVPPAEGKPSVTKPLIMAIDSPGHPTITADCSRSPVQPGKVIKALNSHFLCTRGIVPLVPPACFTSSGALAAGVHSKLVSSGNWHPDNIPFVGSFKSFKSGVPYPDPDVTVAEQDAIFSTAIQLAEHHAPQVDGKVIPFYNYTIEFWPTWAMIPPEDDIGPFSNTIVGVHISYRWCTFELAEPEKDPFDVYAAINPYGGVAETHVQGSGPG